MTGLAWYAWLNLIGLGLLWLLYRVIDGFRGSPSYERAIHHLTVSLGVFFVVAGALDWLPTRDPGWPLQVAAALLIALAGWEILAGFAYAALGRTDGVFEPAYQREVEEIEPSSNLEPALNEDGFVDLDRGTPHSEENREAIGHATRQIFSAESSGVERLRAFGSLLDSLDDGAEEEDEEGSDFALLIVSTVCVALVLGPPCWYAAGLF